MIQPALAAVPDLLRPERAAFPRAPDDWIASPPRYELKYVAPSGRARSIEVLFEGLCTPDGVYPENRIHSVYFEAPDLRTYAEKSDGDYRKGKLRLRWYQADSGDPGSAPQRAWLEVKAKEGSRGSKLRKALEAELPRGPGGRLDPQALRELARRESGLTWRPACWLSYRRRRFTARVGGARVALDRDIRVEWLAPWLTRRRPAEHLPFCVAEVKGATPAPSHHLLVALARLARRTAVSKYALCLEQMRGGAV